MQSGQEVVQLHLDDIIPNRFQPREVFDERALKELAASIKEHGVIQPIIVRQVNNKYEIIAGERRYKASALAGMTKIPAIVNNLDDKEAAKVALLENLQRRNLNPIEEARTYQKILELDQMTQDSLAKTMGKSQSAVANKIRLLSLPDEVQQALLKEEISERHARALLNVDDHGKQKELLNRVINEKLSVRNLEEEIKQIQSPQQGGGAEMNNNQDNANNIFMSASQTEEKPNLMEAFNNIDNNQNSDNTNNNIFGLNQDNNVVNYGNIDEDEIQNENIEFNNDVESSADKKIDVDEVKSNIVDIDQIINEQKEAENNNETKEENQQGNLDNLLNIKEPEPSVFNPMKDLINDQDDNNQVNKDDYFQAPDLMSIQLPNSNNNNFESIMNTPEPQQQNAMINNINNNNNNNNNLINNNANSNQMSSLNDFYSRSFFTNNNNQNNQQPQQNNKKTLGMALIEETYNLPKQTNPTNNGLSINQMIEQIRKTIQNLEQSGAKIDTDEIDFENQYQIVIRIDKNN